jgi:hypothetical protein
MNSLFFQPLRKFSKSSVYLWVSISLAITGCSSGSGSSSTSTSMNCGPDSAVTSSQAISALAEAAYVWSLPLEFTYRFGKYNDLMTAAVNTIAYVPVPAAWNNASTNAGNASVLYINSILDFTGDKTLVYTVPSSDTNFTVTQFLDAFINTYANPGSRTTPDASNPTSYLLVGPDSKYANSKTAVINGITFPVIASGTNRAQFLGRVLAPTLVPATDADSAYNTLVNIAHNIRLNTLEEFLLKGAAPPANGYDIKIPTAAETALAAQYQNTPDNALDFFKQVGSALEANTLPTRSTGLGGIAKTSLPSYIVPQPGTGTTYYSPSAEQQFALATFAPMGLTQAGFKVPCNWGTEQLAALQAGWSNGIKYIQGKLGAPAQAATNWWTYKNASWGTYENNLQGYSTRAVGVISGGFPSLVADGLYAAQFTEGGGTTKLNGDNVYTLTFSPSDANTLPPAGQVIGNQPPLMKKSNNTPVGFWSVTVYQPGNGEAVCPCLSQVSVLNTSYSQALTEVISIDPNTNSITAKVPYGAKLIASSPVLFGAAASEYGLQSDVPYYIVKTPTTNSDGTVTFSVSDKWLQRLSTAEGDPGTPVQFSGQAGPTMSLKKGASKLTYGFVQPVSQLGSSEVAKNMLKKNADGTYTIWFAPTLPAGAFKSNWIPTPSQAYLKALYPGQQVNSTFWPIFRIYAAQPADLPSKPPSILPCTTCSGPETVGGISPRLQTDDSLLATYRFPMLIKQ